MFTGIIQSLGTIVSIGTGGTDTQASIDPGSGLDTDDLRTGDSISVNGVCLTVTECRDRVFHVDISAETLNCSTLGELRKGSRVNLEPALKAGDALGGHMVSGHVDGVGRIVGKEDDGRSVRFLIEAPPNLARYICRKGSVTVDGVSLTVNQVNGHTFSVNIIPHTLEQTLFSGYAEGSSVNIEVDMIARYLEKLLESGGAPRHPSEDTP